MNFIDEKKLFCRAKSAISSLYGIILWSTTLPFSMQIPKQYWSLSPGLKTLIFSQEQSPTHHPSILHSNKIISSSCFPQLPSPTNNFSPLTSSSVCSSMFDDLIGTDSGACLDSNEREISTRIEKLDPYSRSSCKRKCKMRKKYPPPIPLLARTGNLPGHMPWVLTRQCCDGRLILREERLNRHEYFEAHRENGRLILNLVRLDHDVIQYQEEEEQQEEELELQDLELIQEEEEIEEYPENEDGDKREKTMAESVPKSCLEYGIERIRDQRMCFTYAGKRMISESYFSCNVNAHRNRQRGSTHALPFSLPPMTTVV